jgi:hypothetical protein
MTALADAALRLRMPIRYWQALELTKYVFRSVPSSALDRVTQRATDPPGETTYQELAQPCGDRRPEGRLVRRVGNHLWTITSRGQEAMGYEPNADHEYEGWISVECDRYIEQPESRQDIVKDVFGWIPWNHLETELGEQVALSIATVVADDIGAGPERNEFYQASRAIRTPEAAARFYAIVCAMPHAQHWLEMFEGGDVYLKPCYFTHWLKGRR